MYHKLVLDKQQIKVWIPKCHFEHDSISLYIIALHTVDLIPRQWWKICCLYCSWF